MKADRTEIVLRAIQVLLIVVPVTIGVRAMNSRDAMVAESLTIDYCEPRKAGGRHLSQMTFGSPIYLDVLDANGVVLDKSVRAGGMRGLGEGAWVRWDASHEGGPSTSRCVVRMGDKEIKQYERKAE